MLVPATIFATLSAMSVLGITINQISLAALIISLGLLVDNAIVLLGRIDIKIEQNGLAPAQAVPVACRQRLRPILLTTATTIGGMMPLWLGHDPMFETMAVTIMFGLLFATLLTLLFIPVIYTIFFRVRVAL